MMVTVRMRSVVWFVLGAVMAVACGAVLTAAWSAEAAPSGNDTTTVPITACRLVDTRPDTRVGPRDKPLRAEETYVVDVQDRTTWCAGKIPVDADGLVLNLTATRMTAPTFISVWDTGPFPGTSSLNPVPGPAVPNGVTTKLDVDETFRIYNLAGTTHIVIDIVGYLTTSSLAEVRSRLDTVESNGVSESVLNQIETLRGDVEALETTSVSQHTRLTELADEAQPAVWTDREDVGVVTETARVVASVEVEPVADGVVTVFSSVQAEEAKAGDAVRCSITEDEDVHPLHTQRWESGGETGGGFGQMSDLRVFEVEDDERLTINLVCDHLGFSGETSISNSVLTAMFVPG